MKTRPTVMAVTQPNLLFDDRSLLKAAFGDKALTVSSINANCDCDAYFPPQTDEDLNSHQIAPSAVAIN